MKRVDPMAWAFLAIVAVFVGQAMFGGSGLGQGKEAPAVRVPLLGGGTALLGDPKEVQVLDFWATWCGPCVKSMPVVARVAGEYQARGVKLYAVNRDDGDGREERVRGFLRGLNLESLPVALDAGEAADNYAVDVLPTLYVIAGGTIQEVHVGSSLTERELRGAIDAALAQERSLSEPNAGDRP